MAEVPPFPDVPDALQDRILCILCHGLPEKQRRKIISLLDESLQRAKNHTRQLGLLKYEHIQWLPETRLSLRHLYHLSTYLNGKSIITWVALDALSGRNHTVILAQYEPQGKGLQLGRLAAKDAAMRLSEVISGTKDFKDVVDKGNVTLLRDFDLPYGEKDTVPQASSPVDKLPKLSMSGEYSDKDVTVVSISPLSSDDRQAFLRKCKDKVQPEFEEVNFVPWQNNLAATRIDIFNIFFTSNQWEHDTAMVEYRYVLFIDDAALQKDEIIVSKARKYNSEGTWNAERSVVLFRASINDIGKIWKGISSDDDDKTPLNAEHYATDGSSEEEIRRPDAEFGRRKPVFLPQEEPDDGAPPLFFLKSDFTPEEKETIMDELLPKAVDFDEAAGGPHYSLVPWTKDKEGTPDDIVSVMAYLTVNGGYEARYPIFVDGQTARDGTVIMAQCEYDEDGWDPVNREWEYQEDYEGKPGYKQIHWGRIAGRRVHITWVSLDMGNHDFVEETVAAGEMEIVIKSYEEIEELAKKVVLPEDEGEWREIWDAYAAKQIKAHEESGDGKEDKGEDGDGPEPEDAEEGPPRKKAKK